MRTDRGAVAPVRPPLGLTLPANRLRQLLRLEDRLAQARAGCSGGGDDVPAALAGVLLDLPAELAVVWLGSPEAGLRAAAARHRHPSRQRALREGLGLPASPGSGPDRRNPVEGSGPRPATPPWGGAELAGTLQRLLGRARGIRVGEFGPAWRSRLPSRLLDLVDGYQLGSALLAPLAGPDGPLGLLAVARGRTAPLVPADLDLAALLARRAADALVAADLADRLRRQHGLVESVTDAVAAVDERRRITHWNPAAEQMSGIRAEDALGRPLRELLPLTEFVDDWPEQVRAQLRSTGTWRGRVRVGLVTGRTVEVESTISIRPGADGGPAGVVAVCRDLTEVLAARAAVRAQERFTRDLMDALDSRAAVIDGSGTVVSANARWMGGLADRERCVCGPVPEGADWLAALRRSQLPAVVAFADAVAAVLRGELPVARLECRCEPGGQGRATAIEAARVHGTRDAAVVVQSDVSWRRRLQDELTHRAHHDELTGLPNRAALRERLQASLGRLQADLDRRDAPAGSGGPGDPAGSGPSDRKLLAVLFCDLDGFKDINDGLGHAVGDQVLVAVARRLRQRCRAADVVARFGGDEFVVGLPVSDVASARITADRLVEALSEPITVGDAEVAPGASIGIVVVDRPPPGDDPVGTLLRDADTAMYHAKRRGRGRHELFDATLRVEISHRLEYASALRRAIDGDQLRLRYQAQRYCSDRRVVGVEALLRWSHPGLGEIPPGTFVPIAERTGRIVEVGGWALQRATAELAASGDPRLTVAVNVSPRQLSAPHLIDQIELALSRSGLDPHRLVVEITESALADDPSAARAVLTELRRLGLTIALDDFGTGWSSLSFLRTLPVNVIKIDRSFVADLPGDPDACAVVSAVLGLGHGMGLMVVAEGVEKPDQLEVLRDMGCDEYQGFIDGPPGSLDEVLAVQP